LAGAESARRGAVKLSAVIRSYVESQWVRGLFKSPVHATWMKQEAWGPPVEGLFSFQDETFSQKNESPLPLGPPLPSFSCSRGGPDVHLPPTLGGGY